MVAGVAGAALMAAAGAGRAADLADLPGMANPWAGTQWLIRGRIIGMVPDENDGRLGGASADLGVDDAVMPELDFTYFFTDNFAAELILATTKHDVDLGGTKISEVWVLPPTLTLQYHHPMGAFKPYVGAGVNYTHIWSSDATSVIGSDRWEDSFGFALQAGFDWAIDERWSVNVDVKKIFLNLDAKVTAASTPASVDLDPWVLGAGIGYRF
jgi:outer membrane protein